VIGHGHVRDRVGRLRGRAPSLPWLLAARAAQGTSAALLMPNSLAILGVAFPGKEKGRAIGIWAAAGAAMAAVRSGARRMAEPTRSDGARSSCSTFRPRSPRSRWHCTSFRISIATRSPRHMDILRATVATWRWAH
jgi:hypothetical protein